MSDADWVLPAFLPVHREVTPGDPLILGSAGIGGLNPLRQPRVISGHIAVSGVKAAALDTVLFSHPFPATLIESMIPNSQALGQFGAAQAVLLPRLFAVNMANSKRPTLTDK